MLLPLSWMKNYVDIDADIMDYTDKMSDSGSHVESVINLKEGISKIITGKILEIEKHPNADKLSLVKVDLGKEEMQLITGAKNMQKGDYVAVALLGATLPNGMKIERRDLKGIDSIGMLCSYEELGFSDSVVPKNSREGILILDEVELGIDICEVLELNQPTIEFEITPNRPDCLSIIGMARESAATFATSVNMPDLTIREEADDISDYFKGVSIDTDGGLRYVARVVKDVVIKDSPQWMKNSLMQAGMRPINNIVDITNYVMLEMGQPLHAFDIRTIKSGEILVRQAKEGEIMTTLDNVERKLSSEDIVITDGDEIEALAGVMGGLNSEITSSTNTILIESATFDKDYVRKTSKRIGLRTEASQRFEKGISPEITLTAANRVCQLIEQTNSGTVVKGIFDCYNKKQEETVIEMDYNRINQLLGTDISKEDIINYLELLEFKVQDREDQLIIHVPTFRLDIEIPEDITEEIGRLYGYHNITPKPLSGALTRGRKDYGRRVVDYAKEALFGLGFNEVMTYSFISPRSYEKIEKETTEEEYIKIINPLGEDYSVMRTTLIPTMMDVFTRNLKNHNDQLSIYEIGNSFHPEKGSVLPKEKLHLTMGAYGDVDFYYLKDAVTKVLYDLGISDIRFKREENNSTFHEGRCANIVADGEVIGTMGQISYQVMDHYDIDKEIYIGELDFEKIERKASFIKTYDPIIKYPSIKRDIAIVVDKEVESDRIEEVIHAKGEELIKGIYLFDSYEGEHIEKGKKSLAYSIIFQAEDRTLKDEEVSVLYNNILESLEKEMNAALRS